MIEFYCFDPDVAREMPIIPARDYSFEWIKKARQFYQSNNEAVQTTRCPGIFSMLYKGWIQRTYQDITIITNGDGESVKIITEKDQNTLPGGRYTSDYVSTHSRDQLARFKSWPKETLKTVLKIQSPWTVKVPKGYSLLMMPLPYHDDIRFTAATGTLIGTNFINVQLYWHCLKGRQTIKAGTAINQMLLIKEENVESAIKVIDDIDEFAKELPFGK